MALNLEAAGLRIVEAMREELEALAFELLGRITKNAPTGWSGQLRGSFDVEAKPTTSGFLAVAVGTPVEHGTYVEHGTRPHWAPLDPLIRWVEGKIQPHVLAVGVSFEGGRRARPGRATRVLRGDARQREILRVARLIQLKIAARGTRAQKFVARSIEELGLPYEQAGVGYVVDLRSWLERRLPAIVRRVQEEGL